MDSPGNTEKIRVRGLAQLSGALFGGWGLIVTVKAVYDLFAGEPEANLFSAEKWMFVTREQWLRYGGFELAYGLACLALCVSIFKYARFLPYSQERPKREPGLQLFG